MDQDCHSWFCFSAPAVPIGYLRTIYGYIYHPNCAKESPMNEANPLARYSRTGCSYHMRRVSENPKELPQTQCTSPVSDFSRAMPAWNSAHWAIMKGDLDYTLTLNLLWDRVLGLYHALMTENWTTRRNAKCSRTPPLQKIDVRLPLLLLKLLTLRAGQQCHTIDKVYQMNQGY